MRACTCCIRWAGLAAYRAWPGRHTDSLSHEQDVIPFLGSCSRRWAPWLCAATSSPQKWSASSPSRVGARVCLRGTYCFCYARLVPPSLRCMRLWLPRSLVAGPCPSPGSSSYYSFVFTLPPARPCRAVHPERTQAGLPHEHGRRRLCAALRGRQVACALSQGGWGVLRQLQAD